MALYLRSITDKGVDSLLLRSDADKVSENGIIGAGGIESEEFHGLPTISASISSSGIVSDESIGSLSLSASITSLSIISGEMFGSPTIEVSKYIVPRLIGPNLSMAIKGWTRNKELIVITKTVSNAKVVQAEVSHTVKMNFQPLQAEKVNRKPEDQRAWKWYSLLILSSKPVLKIDDVIIIDDIRYRVGSVQNWYTSGYRRYEAYEDYVLV